MKNIKRTISIGIIVLAFVVLGHTIYGSVFYASNDGASVDVNDGGGIPVVEAQTTAATGITSTINTSSKPTIAKTKATSTPISNSDSMLPTRLIIPSLNIDANVQLVTVNAKGNMGTPNNFTDVSWYKPGTIPGQIGSAVMAGHVDNGLALPGVFKHLDTIKVGDNVYVTNGNGTKLHFVVEKIESYPYAEVPTEAIFTAKDGKRLNLVTCVGAWVPGQKTYDQRLVVYTKLVE